ncbi:ankyrin repeat protein, putative [Trichomonas vaginalis G3]|uniref:Ankyrin repeat protein, putative n=1 Tax=Trichomonas vaginalis (strain ATCC PRA-98 / G3) TaxID=412133 RepID=A2FLR8_TRIV3|nr:protein ubiquitination [Trichomonas vaginalis G3]EAX94160.1 ankyrin repeat protein, putative [Trichomonas vaginalis G3]KAI5518073.1 protein ubiquitination [Trichomonas vaginalis G3]|eukprot:XP_001307090.1 ankyrin repeat protein [Trichomonas vaginalis G3]
MYSIEQLKDHRSSSVFYVLNRAFKEMSPLLIAILAHRLDIIQYLLENKYPVNSYVGGTYALHVACFLNYPDVVDLLLFYGASPILVDDRNLDPLSIAVTYEYIDIIESLLYTGYDPKYLALPLFIAITNNNIDIVGTLVLHGADANIECSITKKKPIDIIKSSQVEITNIIQNVKPLPKADLSKKARLDFITPSCQALNSLVEDISYSFKPKDITLHQIVIRSKDSN